MSNAGDPGAILYEAETAFGENVNTFATHRIPHNGQVDVGGLKHDKINPGALVQTLQGGVQWVRGPQQGTFKTKVYLAGHGSSTSGAITLDPIETWLGFALGNALRTATAGGTASATGTATTLTTAIATMAEGGLFRVGTGGLSADGRGNGQGGVVASHVSSTVTSLVAFDAASVLNDVIKPCVNFFLPEDPTDASAAITGIRMEFLTANNRYRCHGCVATDVAISGLNAGELPVAEITWTVSWWEYSAAAGTFPSAVTSNRYLPAPCAAGTFFLAAVGTATRTAGTTLRNVRSVSLAIKLGVAMLPGPNGVSPWQVYVGAIRTMSQVTWSWTEDAGAAADTPELDGFFTGTTAYHLLYTCNTVDGKSLMFYSPNLCYSGPRPVQQITDGVNRMPIQAMAYTGPDTASQLSQSALRVGFS